MSSLTPIAALSVGSQGERWGAGVGLCPIHQWWAANRSCHCQLMSCSPYCNSHQQKLIKKLQAEKAFQEEIQSFQETMKSFREKIKGFQEKIRDFKMAIQAFCDKEKPVWEEEAAFWEEEKAIQEEAEAFWRVYCDFWKDYNASGRRIRISGKEMSSSGRKTGSFWMRTESYGQTKKLCGQMKQLSLKRKELSGKMRRPSRKVKKNLKEYERLTWEEAFGPEREDISRDATVHRGKAWIVLLGSETCGKPRTLMWILYLSSAALQPVLWNNSSSSWSKSE